MNIIVYLHGLERNVFATKWSVRPQVRVLQLIIINRPLWLFSGRASTRRQSVYTAYRRLIGRSQGRTSTRRTLRWPGGECPTKPPDNRQNTYDDSDVIQFHIYANWFSAPSCWLTQVDLYCNGRKTVMEEMDSRIRFGISAMRRTFPREMSHNCVFLRGIRVPIIRFLGPTRVHNPNGILIGSAFYHSAQLCPTDTRRRHTDHIHALHACVAA